MRSLTKLEASIKKIIDDGNTLDDILNALVFLTQERSNEISAKDWTSYHMKLALEVFSSAVSKFRDKYQDIYLKPDPAFAIIAIKPFLSSDSYDKWKVILEKEISEFKKAAGIDATTN